MKRMSFGIHLSLFALLLLPIVQSGSAQTMPDSPSTPAVVRAVAPRNYPAIARAARASGKVLVTVTINPEGRVSSTRIVSGHALLQEISAQAARKWRFSPAQSTDERAVELEFVYTEAAREEEAGVYYAPPYQVEIKSYPPTVEVTNKDNARPRN